MTSNETPYAEACLDIIKENDDENRIRLASAMLRDYPIGSIDFSNPLSWFLEPALSSAFLAAYHREDYRMALEFSNAAADVALCLNDNPQMRARTANNCALALMELGDFVKAAKLFRDALAFLKHTDNDIFNLGETIRANLDVMEQMAGRETCATPPKLSAYHLSFRSYHALNNEALKLLNEGKPNHARDLLYAALEACETGDAKGRATVLSNLGEIEREIGNIAQAKTTLDEARRLCAEVGYSGQVLAGILYNLGELKIRNQGTAEECAVEFKEAWDIIRQVSPRSRKALLILRSLALTRMVQRDLHRARGILDRALAIYDEMRADTGTTEQELEGLFTIYRYLSELRLYVALHEDSGVEAYQLMLKAKTRYWVDSLAKRSSAGTTFTLKLDALVSDYDFSRLIGFNGTLLEFFVGPNATFLFVVHNKYVAAYRLDITESELNVLVNGLRERLLLGLPCDAEVAELSLTLFRNIYFPWPRHRFIMIAPDGPLWSIPMHVLVPSASASRSLEEIAPNATIPSASVISQMRNNPQAKSATRVVVVVHTLDGDISALADPSDEIEIVRSSFSGCEFLELGEHLGTVGRATPVNVLSRLANASHIHILAHAAAGNSDVEPHLVLAGDDVRDVYLTATQIQALQLRADLVVLAACESSLGPVSPGEGLASLARAFLLAGTKCVVASLWEVRDESVRDFLRRFYSRVGNGKTVARAFWEAKKDYAEAFGRDDTWAGMILLGDAEDIDEAFDIAELHNDNETKENIEYDDPN